MSLKQSNVLQGSVWQNSHVNIGMYFPIIKCKTLSPAAKYVYAYLCWVKQLEPKFKLFDNEGDLANTLSFPKMKLLAALYELMKEHRVQMFFGNFYFAKLKPLRFDSFHSVEPNVGRYCGLMSRPLHCESLLLPEELFCIYAAINQIASETYTLKTLSQFSCCEVGVGELESLSSFGFINFKRKTKNSPYMLIKQKRQPLEAGLAVSKHRINYASVEL